VARTVGSVRRWNFVFCYEKDSKNFEWLRTVSILVAATDLMACVLQFLPSTRSQITRKVPDCFHSKWWSAETRESWPFAPSVDPKGFLPFDTPGYHGADRKLHRSSASLPHHGGASHRWVDIGCRQRNGRAVDPVDAPAAERQVASKRLPGGLTFGDCELRSPICPANN